MNNDEIVTRLNRGLRQIAQGASEPVISECNRIVAGMEEAPDVTVLGRFGLVRGLAFLLADPAQVTAALVDLREAQRHVRDKYYDSYRELRATTSFALGYAYFRAAAESTGEDATNLLNEGVAALTYHLYSLDDVRPADTTLFNWRLYGYALLGCLYHELRSSRVARALRRTDANIVLHALHDNNEHPLFALCQWLAFSTPETTAMPEVSWTEHLQQMAQFVAE